MDPLSIAAVGWLMSSLVNKAVTALLEAWAKRIGLGNEFETLKDQLLQLGALLTSAHHLPTHNSFLEELVLNLQQLAYQAENLLDELDYYRLEDQIQQRGNHEKENCSKKSLVASSSSGDLLASHPITSTLEQIYTLTAPYAPLTLPKTSPSIKNLSRRMNELAEQLQKSQKDAEEELSLILDQSSSFKVGELLAFHELSSLHSLTISHISSLESFHELSSLRYLTISHISSMESFPEKSVIPHLHYLKISHISSLESLDLHSFVALEKLVIEECQSLTSLTFGDQLVCLRSLEIRSCKTLSSVKGLKSWVNLSWLEFRGCPGFIPAWDSASKEIERTEPDFSLSLTTIYGDSLALLTLPICKQLTSLEYFWLEVSAFTEEHEVSPQLLTSIDLVDIEGCKKNLQSFPFDLFPSLKELEIRFRHIDRLPTSSCTEITDECKKLRNIKEVHFGSRPLKVIL
ncbi:adenylate cyclase regulatory protein [Carex littledalei]|uniref:Adenylate cyclase regulatory protein n=1 Tax=Carex littledalei TaxID=544730 RepID=A0A833VTS4_9POAL|nr:adenylate cyclase regulatory protein [Carex littledalei]